MCSFCISRSSRTCKMASACVCVCDGGRLTSLEVLFSHLTTVSGCNARQIIIQQRISYF